MYTSIPSANATLLSFNYGKIHVATKTVKYIKSIYGNYSVLKFANRKQIMSSYTLSHYSSILERNDNFFNIRKGILINLHFMREIEKQQDGYYAVMNDGTKFRMSRRKGRELVSFLKRSIINQEFPAE